MAVICALILILVLLVCWLLTVAGLPGNWLMPMSAGVYLCLAPARSPVAIGWKTIAALLFLAALGEIIELLAGAMGVAKAGGSKRGAAMALVGSIIGGLVGLAVGVPVPLVGSIVAAVLFAGLGAMARQLPWVRLGLARTWTQAGGSPERRSGGDWWER